MKLPSRILIKTLAMLVTCFITKAQNSNDINVSGEYNGKITGGSTVMAMTLKITQTGNNIKGVLNYNDKSWSGSSVTYDVSGTVDQQNRTIRLKDDGIIEEIAKHTWCKKIYSGKIVANNGTVLELSGTWASDGETVFNNKQVIYHAGGCPPGTFFLQSAAGVAEIARAQKTKQDSFLLKQQEKQKSKLALSTNADKVAGTDPLVKDNLRPWIEQVIKIILSNWEMTKYEDGGIAAIKANNLSSPYASQTLKAFFSYIDTRANVKKDGWVEFVVKDDLIFYMHLWNDPNQYYTPLIRAGGEKNSYVPEKLEKILKLQENYNTRLHQAYMNTGNESYQAVMKKQRAIPATEDIGGCIVEITEPVQYTQQVTTTHQESVTIGYRPNGEEVSGINNVKTTSPGNVATRIEKRLKNKCSHPVTIRGIRTTMVDNGVEYIDASIRVPAFKHIDYVEIEPVYDKYAPFNFDTHYFKYVSKTK